MSLTSLRSFPVLALLALAFFPAPALAQHRLCDPGAEDCRQVLIDHIRAEQVGLDVAFWFMEDAWIASEVINKYKSDVPVGVLMDTEANSPNPLNADRLAELAAAKIPMRERIAGGILHWKMMLFAGQNIVQVSAANYSSDAWVYSGAPRVFDRPDPLLAGQVLLELAGHSEERHLDLPAFLERGSR